MTKNELEKLVSELVKLKNETEWVEFKLNNTNPEEIGKDISALSNGAALLMKKIVLILYLVLMMKHMPLLEQHLNQKDKNR